MHWTPARQTDRDDSHSRAGHVGQPLLPPPPHRGGDGGEGRAGCLLVVIQESALTLQYVQKCLDLDTLTELLLHGRNSEISQFFVTQSPGQSLYTGPVFLARTCQSDKELQKKQIEKEANIEHRQVSSAQFTAAQVGEVSSL